MKAKSLLKAAEILIEHRGRGRLSTIATYAVNDGKFFERISRNGGCTLETANIVIRWLAQNWIEGAPWPPDLPWPSDVPRPQKSNETGEAA